jgi:acyl-CoA thioester hydrolase
MSDLAGRLMDNGHELVQRVYFEDTDFSGRVYHARYLHFLERGRSDYLRLLGIHHRELAEDGLAFVVRRMDIEFLAPAAIDDELTIVSRPERIGNASIVLSQSIRCGGRRLVSAEVKVALVDGAGKPARMPAPVRNAFG